MHVSHLKVQVRHNNNNQTKLGYSALHTFDAILVHADSTCYPIIITSAPLTVCMVQHCIALFFPFPAHHCESSVRSVRLSDHWLGGEWREDKDVDTQMARLCAQGTVCGSSANVAHKFGQSLDSRSAVAN